MKCISPIIAVSAALLVIQCGCAQTRGQQNLPPVTAVHNSYRIVGSTGTGCIPQDFSADSGQTGQVEGDGHLFVGQSGAGKTTIARLWQKEKDVKILSDDRIVLRNIDGKLWMYGTPWHGEAMLSDPSRAPLTRIYFLHHGEKNEVRALENAEAAGRLFACSFPPFYDADALDFTLAFFDEAVKAVSCRELSFVPDRRVVDFVLT